MSEKKTVWRYAPCPAYDVEGTESWLSDMASDGLLLSKDGFLCGFGIFDKTEPTHAIYRLEAAQKSTSMFSDDGGTPDPDAIDLMDRYDWSYIANRGDFYIYRTLTDDAREINTDPAVQAMALNTVKKKQLQSALIILFWWILFPMLRIKAGFLLLLAGAGTALFTLGAAIILTALLKPCVAFVHLAKMQKKLRNGDPLTHEKDWKKVQKRHILSVVCETAVIIAFIVLCVIRWDASMLNKDKILRENYYGVLPFATMRDFALGEELNYRETMTGLGSGFNCVRERYDLICRRFVDYNENASIIAKTGETLDGGYNVEYYEMSFEFLARALEREILRFEKKTEDYVLMDSPNIECDSVTAYRSYLHFPTVLIRKGNVVIKAYLYQTGQNEGVSFDRWVTILADSIK